MINTGPNRATRPGFHRFSNISEFHQVRRGWLLLLGITAVFALLYLHASLFPGAIDPSVSRYFSLALAEKARSYNLPFRVLYIVRLGSQICLLAYLLVSSRGKRIFKRIQNRNRPYGLTIGLSILLVWVAVQLVSLPFTYYLGFTWQKLWGFSTQSQAAWWIDYLKNSGIDLVITLVGGLLFFGLVQRFSRSWWLIGSVAFSLWLVLDYLLWPLVVAPLFNHFVPLTNSAITTMVGDLAHKAGLQINGILVMDASRQTTFANAYFTGLGASKRIVLYDTLLNHYSLPEVKAVIAHEMGHWRHEDVIKGLLYGMTGVIAVFGLLTVLLKPWLSSKGKNPPQLWVALQLALLLILFVSNPLQNAISRQMELSADRFSLQLTGDLPTEIQLQKNLAQTNLSDFSPPSFIVWFSYDHPPVLSRIEALEKEKK